MKRSAPNISKPAEAARAPASLCKLMPLARPQVIAGIDVAENFLDIAVLRIRSATIEHRRIVLEGIQADPLSLLSARLRECCPGIGPQWMVLIDSPRWPRDLDCSSATPRARDPVPAGRMLDQALRGRLRGLTDREPIRLSMFPTPRLEYFTGCIQSPSCKPHLRSIYERLFGNSVLFAASGNSPGPLRGGTFTRFMLAGFAAFRACQETGAQTVEAYPELEFRLAGGGRLPPKAQTKAALAQRVATIARLRQALAISAQGLPKTLDQADAEVLALSAAAGLMAGKLAALEDPAEGLFLVTF